ncbi:MAG: hypothetical protein K6C37_03855 [Bacteroidales bacterium]|nr:hypothetical protein [Bacteroidales bacterium]
MLLASVMLFMAFSRLSFKSRSVNFLATGVFGTYILSGGPLVKMLRAPLTLNLYERADVLGVFLQAMLVTMICLSISVSWTWLRNKLFGRLFAWTDKLDAAILRYFH